MKKLAVYSFFDSHNIGDILIAKQVETIFSDRCDCRFFNIENGKPKAECGLKPFCPSGRIGFKQRLLSIPILRDMALSLASVLSKTSASIIESGRDADTVVFAGGNQIMELNRLPSGIITLYRAVKAFKRQGKTVCFCFCGIGPFQSVFGKRLAKKIIAMSDFVAVRDGYSHRLATALVPQKEISVWNDPVLLMDRPAKKEKPAAVGVNVYFGYEKSNRTGMEAAFVTAIRQFRQTHPDIPVLLFSSELCDIQDIRRVYTYFENDPLVTVKDIACDNELFAFYDSVSAVIATRMHTLITATVSGVPATAISWQHKVRALMEILEKESLSISAEDFISTPERAADALTFCLDNDAQIADKNAAILAQIREKTNQSIAAFFEQEDPYGVSL